MSGLPRPVRWAPLLIVLGWLLATAWVRPLAMPDEGRYVGVAWEMLRSGDWLTPRLDGLPYFHKPPLFYWITATSLSVFGLHEWPARLAPWLGAGVGAAALYLFAWRWWGERVARLSMLVLATQPLVFAGAQFANLDMLVAGCIAACIFGFAHAALLPDGERGRRPVLAMAYVFAALAVLAKGLIGLVLPALVIGSWLLLRREWRRLPGLLWLPGPALFLLVAGPWFVLMQLRFPAFAHYFFVVQHFSRFAAGGFNNQQPLWFFPVVLVLLALPWSAWLLAGLRRRPMPEPDPTRRALRQLLWLWLALVTLFFSLPQSKLVGYILPVTWPLALLVADGFATRVPQSRQVSGLWRASAFTAVAACAALVLFSGLLPQKSSRELARVLQGRVGATDRMVFLHEYPFDFPFYAHLQQPVAVVEDWGGDASRRDNWRKELADAGQFDSAAARALLVAPAAWPALVCDAEVTWVVGTLAAAARYPVMQQAEVVVQRGDRAVWRLSGRTPALLRAGVCDGKPSANSGSTS